MHKYYYITEYLLYICYPPDTSYSWVKWILLVHAPDITISLNTDFGPTRPTDLAPWRGPCSIAKILLRHSTLKWAASVYVSVSESYLRDFVRPLELRYVKCFEGCSRAESVTSLTVSSCTLPVLLDLVYILKGKFPTVFCLLHPHRDYSRRLRVAFGTIVHYLGWAWPTTRQYRN